MTTSSIDYPAVIAGLEAQAAEYADLARRLRALTGAGPQPNLRAPVPILTGTSPEAGTPLASAILAALTDEPLNQFRLGTRALRACPGHTRRQVAHACRELRNRKEIYLGPDSLWHMGQPEPEAPVEQPPQAAASFGLSLAEAIRRAAGEPAARTKALIVERVMSLCPSARNGSVRAELNVLITMGDLHYDPEDNWGVRRIIDGAMVYPKFDLNGAEVNVSNYSMARNGKQANARAVNGPELCGSSSAPVMAAFRRAKKDRRNHA